MATNKIEIVYNCITAHSIESIQWTEVNEQQKIDRTG